MTSNAGGFPPFSTSTSGRDAGPPSGLRRGFITHKYLLLAILNCLQARQPRRQSPAAPMQDHTVGHRWMREPSAEREVTPCIVMREHHDRGDLSVVRLLLEDMVLQTLPLAQWMRSEIPPSCEPDRDTVHLAIAPTLPGVPIVVHSVAADGESVTHLFSGGLWTRSANDDFLLRAIRYAQLVATAIPLSHALQHEHPAPAAQRRGTAPADRASQPCDLVTLGLRYDHIAVHAALKELRAFRGRQGAARMAPPVVGPPEADSGRQLH